MKKQFSIKSISVKKTVVTAAKSESANLLKFLKPADCCPTAEFTALIKPAIAC
jgi:hypothetical protein